MKNNIKIAMSDLGIDYQDNSYLNLSDNKIVVLTNVEENQIVRTNIMIHSLNGEILEKHQLCFEKKIIICIPFQNNLILVEDVDYEDFVPNIEPNVLIWNTDRGVINKFFGGRFINSLAVDLDNSIWIGYDEMGIFSCLKNDISMRGINRFHVNDNLVSIGQIDAAMDLIDSYSFTYINQRKIFACYMSKGNYNVCEINEGGLIVNKEILSFVPVSLFIENDIKYYFYNDSDGYIRKVATNNDDSFNLIDSNDHKIIKFSYVFSQGRNLVGVVNGRLFSLKIQSEK
ncbi:hypothetical protein [Shouchella miscanthi]|uniref:WG repeat-containing protein n=1 Tax=Shouchella miscanthi TaxID=2598861 RepID=A0ABU6NRC8_9BACI|nr:hypothetical protein [Shouchella miscanthi]